LCGKSPKEVRANTALTIEALRGRQRGAFDTKV
jgi:hypothetical protein